LGEPIVAYLSLTTHAHPSTPPSNLSLLCGWITSHHLLVTTAQLLALFAVNPPPQTPTHRIDTQRGLECVGYTHAPSSPHTADHAYMRAPHAPHTCPDTADPHNAHTVQQRAADAVRFVAKRHGAPCMDCQLHLLSHTQTHKTRTHIALMVTPHHVPRHLCTRSTLVQPSAVCVGIAVARTDGATRAPQQRDGACCVSGRQHAQLHGLQPRAV
jgi:hypothetical protein